MPLFINSIFKIELKIKLKLNNPLVETLSDLKKNIFLNQNNKFFSKEKFLIAILNL